MTFVTLAGSPRDAPRVTRRDIRHIAAFVPFGVPVRDP
jgi:hypothetical protein